MAYRRNYPKKKAPLGKRLQKAGKYAWKHRSTAVKAFQLASKVARMVNVEYKQDTRQNSTTVNNLGTVISLCDSIDSGDAYNERDGDSVKLIRMSGRVFITQHGSAQKTLFRVILFRGKQENCRSYVVQDTNSTGNMGILDHNAGTGDLVLAPKSRENRFHSKILFDKMYHMSNNGNSSIVANWDFKLFGHCNFNDFTNPNEIEDGGLYMLLISNETTNTPTFNSFLKISYTDN